METEIHKIIEDLDKEKAYLLDRIKRIDIALDALRGEQPVESKGKSGFQRTIQWKAEIKKAFEETEELSLKALRNKLVSNGIPEAQDKKFSHSIYATLSRLVQQGYIEKIGHGLYRRKKKRLHFPTGAETQ